MTHLPLGEICEFRYGAALPDRLREQGPVPVFGSNGQVGSHTLALTDGPTIVIGRKGSIGEINYSSGSCWPIDTTYYIDKSATKHDLRWLAYALGNLGLNRLNKATGVPGLNRNDAYEKRLFVPSLAEQQRIATILDQAEALRRQRREAMERLGELPAAMFVEMFGDPVVNNFGWPLKKISEIGQVVTGNTPSRVDPNNYGSEIEWIKSENINNSSYYATQATEYLSSAGGTRARLMPAETILVTCIAGTPSCIGNAGMLDRPAAFNQQINGFKVEMGDPHFIYAQLREWKQLVQSASTNSMKGMVSKSKFQAIELIFPEVHRQVEFARMAAKFEEARCGQQRSLSVLDALFSSLQHRAFNGELTAKLAERELAEAG